MYEEPRRAKRRPVRRRRGCCLFGLIKIVIAFALILVVGLVAFNSISGLGSFFGGGNFATSSTPGGWTNVLLLGADSRSQDQNGRTDSIMIASINNWDGRIKLTSIMRDTMVPIEGHGTNKINAAHAYGGPELAVRTVNQAFGLDITKYAVIDFYGFPSLVDALGGVNIDITQEEMKQINRYAGDASREVANAQYSELTNYGENTHLNGSQALAYSRIRKIDSDYKRAERQRTVLEALLKKARKTRNPLTLVQFGRTALQYCDTNLNIVDIGRLGAVVMLNGSMEQNRIPFDGTYDSGNKDGIWSIRPNLDENKRLLREYIYN